MAAEVAPQRYALEKVLDTPAAVTSLAFGHAGHLFAGSDDGTLRVYDLSTFKVLKAVRGLGAEVSSIVCLKRPGSDLRDAWVAHGHKISKFQLSTDKMIQNTDDAVSSIDLGESPDVVLNELALSSDKSHLAFGLDSGEVGVMELSSETIIRMGDKHSSVCGCVKFIPDRPRELISGGYDTNIIHFDWTLKAPYDKRQMDPFAAVDGVALSPPFIMSLAVSTSGVLAAGTADGRLWIGFGGEKIPNVASKKKVKKWEGLDAASTLIIKVAEGPIVAATFSDARLLTVSTLLGTVTQYRLVYKGEGDNVLLQRLWTKEVTEVEKVNAILADDRRIVIGGLTAGGKGVIAVYKLDPNAPPVPEV